MAQVRYGRADGRWVLLATVLGSGMAFLDATVVNIALPHIGDEFHAGAASLQWIVNGYTLSLASLILLGGTLGDRFGRRRVFVLGVGWFAVASLLCGLAPNVQMLIAARVLQGVGGALLAPGSLAIIEASFHPDDRARAIGSWSGLGGVAGAIGPFLGGWLVQAATWRLVFLINVPIAVLVCVVAVRRVPESRNPDAARSIDMAGVVTAAAGLAGLTYGFTAWPERGGGSPVVLAALALGLAGIIGFLLVERHAKEPMLPLDTFRSRAFSAANLVTFAVYAALSGVLFLVVLNLQVVVHFTALSAGVSMLPVTALMLLLSARAGALAQRIGPRIPMTVGPIVCACAMLLFSRIGGHSTYLRNVLPAVVVLGLGLSLTVAPLTATALGSVDERHAGIASGVNNAVARAAGLLAVAILPLAAGLGGGSLTVAADLGPMYHRAMLICSVLLLIGAFIAFVSIPTKLAAAAGPEPQPREEVRVHCAIAGTPLQPHPAHGAHEPVLRTETQ
ncbi:MFS transporter [Actinospica sp.]|jgi:EmrB/QacA subfamily drug resistance transporter|uniref:MFS transporter n=1 Tax=Actinospica sp. TaxID=1872142 RepID=UPI002C6C2594|nr:MFS transporter [Actinospica sp.]HWG24107.1 MFS transporter [Actinospica sp.]